MIKATNKDINRITWLFSTSWYSVSGQVFLALLDFQSLPSVSLLHDPRPLTLDLALVRARCAAFLAGSFRGCRSLGATSSTTLVAVERAL